MAVQLTTSQPIGGGRIWIADVAADLLTDARYRDTDLALIKGTSGDGNEYDTYIYKAGTWTKYIDDGATVATPWFILGNTGTNPATDFVGTNDAAALVFRTNTVFSGYLDSSTGNAFFGPSTGNQTLSGSDNAAMGSQSLVSITTGSRNVAIGRDSLNALTTGSDNVSIGRDAMALLLAGSSNIAIGREASHSLDDSNNIAIGNFALTLAATGQFNIAIGQLALGNTTAPSGLLIAIGFRALFNNTTGTENVGVGNDSLQVLTTGQKNTAIGEGALISSNGDRNVALGNATLPDLTTGSQNTSLGSTTGRHVTTGSNNTFLGYNTTVPIPDVNSQNRTAIGANAVANEDNSIYFGDSIIHYNFNQFQQFANNAAAITGGLVVGDLYTVTGSDPRQVAQVF